MSGAFSFAGTFDRTESFRASKEGYTSATQPYGLHTAFVLKNLAPAVDIRGDYTLTISVDPECKFPDAARTRTYTARIDGYGQVSGAILVEDQSEFATYFDGDTVVFSTEFDGQPWLVEQLGPTEYLAFHGTATATIQPPLMTVSIPFRGYIEICLTDRPGKLLSQGLHAFPEGHALHLTEPSPHVDATLVPSILAKEKPGHDDFPNPEGSCRPLRLRHSVTDPVGSTRRCRAGVECQNTEHAQHSEPVCGGTICRHHTARCVRSRERHHR